MTRKFSTLVCGLMACSALTTPAFAQEQAEEAPTMRDDNVIIVTATRRAQDVQDIPLAVTAIAPQQLEAQRVVDIRQVATLAPLLHRQPGAACLGFGGAARARRGDDFEQYRL